MQARFVKGWKVYKRRRKVPNGAVKGVGVKDQTVSALGERNRSVRALGGRKRSVEWLNNGKVVSQFGEDFGWGHNLLILARDLGQYIQLGTTIDDAIGEAYDKTAKWLGLDLRRSGGPAIEKLAVEGNAESVKFSIPMKQHKDYNFSYAGLKTQVRLAIESKKM
ncbi:hypothetical protein LR48_Vigan805s000300 [Vigna angularis]|uniref:Gcp-like domain-containing protein n=1 Tax=Phaseolus angularis TaxID=3914 RepID=A0A0L9TGS6_PHAAN|nr:hypothetical protein LR48_Vigan805s000300 [Vigna angularis]